MKLFKLKKPASPSDNQASLAELALKTIHDGVILTDKTGVIQFINPAAVAMTEYGSADRAIGLDYGLVIKLESKEGRELSERDNPLIQAMRSGQALESTHAALIPSQSGKRIPIAISMLPVEGISQNRIITFRNITRELEEEGEQTEFISTASHEMRTPVATIDGYLSLCLNPQTATLDNRARGYLTAAQMASRHLGKLFQDLLDITRLDDGKIRPHFEPAEMTSLVRSITNDYIARANEAKLNFSFGSDRTDTPLENRRLQQVVYSFVDPNFVREILDNLIENAIKYTPAGGSIYVNVRGDGDRVLINVTDTGIGISNDDLNHIFQKFYRADNSDTREIGGTGLGLYLVKQRVEAMGGKVWAESAFGEGSTFYVSLPRITNEEYEKRMIAVRNQAIQPQPVVMAPPRPAQAVQPVQPAQPIQQLAQPVQPAQSQTPPQPQPTQPAQVTQVAQATQVIQPKSPPPAPRSGAPVRSNPPRTASTTPTAPTKQIDINLKGEKR